MIVALCMLVVVLLIALVVLLKRYADLEDLYDQCDEQAEDLLTRCRLMEAELTQIRKSVSLVTDQHLLLKDRHRQLTHSHAKLELEYASACESNATLQEQIQGFLGLEQRLKAANMEIAELKDELFKTRTHRDSVISGHKKTLNDLEQYAVRERTSRFGLAEEVEENAASTEA